MTDWHPLLKERLAGLRIRPEREAEILDELAQHLDDQVRELTSGGIAPEEARLAALADLDATGVLAKRLGDIETRPLLLPPPGAPARGRLLQALIQDIRYSIRGLRRAPLFSLTVIATLALTIGPTTAILSIGNWLVWRPTPGVHEPGQLAVAQTGIPTERGVTSVAVSDANIQDLRAAAKAVAGIAGLNESNVHLAGDGLPPDETNAGVINWNALDLLGAPLIAGRMFRAEDDREPISEPVVIVRAAIAARAFGNPQASLGKQITLNGKPMTIVGVVADHFTGTTPLSLVDVWYPGAAYGYVNHFTSTKSLTDRGGGFFRSFVIRLAPGASLEQAQAELDVLFPALADQYPADNAMFRKVRATLMPGLTANMSVRFGPTVNILLAIGGVLLLLGCANVANVLMMRAVRMSRDRAIRLSLGASRARLASLQLTESALLALAGAAAGVVLALWLKQLIVWLLFPGLPPGFELDAPIDMRVLVLTLGISLVCGLFAGFIPSIASRRLTPGPGIAGAGNRSVTPIRWLRGGLAAIQLALSLALVTGSLLLGATLREFYSVDLGFDPSHTSRHLVNPMRQGYPLTRANPYFIDLLERLQNRSGLEAVAVSGLSPFGSSFGVRLQDPAGAERSPISVFSNNVSADYFDVLKMRFVRGRGFTDAEALAHTGGAYPVIVNEELARRLFGAADPLGRTVTASATANHPLLELPVIGVVASAQWNNIIGERPMFMFRPFAAETRPSSTVLVRSTLNMAEVTRIVQDAAREIDPALPVRLSQPISALVDQELTEQRVLASMLSLLAWVAFLLAAVGLYGLLAQSVAERTREFGVRLAMGSGRTHIFALVLRQAGWIAVFGTVAGLTLAGFGTKLIETQLYGVTRLDAATYVLSALALAIVAFAAALWPARTATRIEPVEALRTE